MAKRKAILLYAASDNCADMLYFSKIFVPDPFWAISCNGKKYAVVSPLEYSRVLRSGVFDQVWCDQDIFDQIKKKDSSDSITPVSMVLFFQKTLGIDYFVLSEQFPAGIAMNLIEKRISFRCQKNLFPERVQKTKDECKMIAQGNAASARGIAKAKEILEKSVIKGDRLIYQNRALTSESLRQAIDIACLEAGAVAKDTIVAGGKQACDPHERGTGLLRPHQLIIVDVFPRFTSHGYHGDMTRTFLKGSASESQKKLVATVRKAQKLAFSKIKSRIHCRSIHQTVKKYFFQQDYQTEKREGVYQGFFHGTGHGLGLEVHEAPSLGNLKDVLKTGQVITVEPGLYYPDIGGCRIEDVVVVKSDGYKKLSSAPYKWILL